MKLKTTSPICHIKLEHLIKFKLIDRSNFDVTGIGLEYEKIIRSVLLNNDKMYNEFLYLCERVPEAGVRATIRHLLSFNRRHPEKFRMKGDS